MEQPQMQQPYYQAPAPEEPAIPMKWHNFLCRFGLWAGGVLNILFGVFSMLGQGHGDQKDIVDMFFPQMKTYDIVYGVLCIILGLLCLYAAYSLLKMKANAPKLYLGLLILTGVVNIGYYVAEYIVFKNPVGMDEVKFSGLYMSAAGTAVITIVVIALNKIYYDKRQHLFVN